jgi:hypothetical protein
MTQEKRVDLKDVEPLRPVDEPEAEMEQPLASTPAVGVNVDAQKDSPTDEDPLDKLRRD